eukprot:11353132-Alexandrium_andersonii.AAC.1
MWLRSFRTLPACFNPGKGHGPRVRHGGVGPGHGSLCLGGRPWGAWGPEGPQGDGHGCWGILVAGGQGVGAGAGAVSYTHLRAHETSAHL